MKRETLLKLNPIFLSIIFSIIVGSLPLFEFKDRLNYLEHINNSDVMLLINLGNGIHVFLANESLWFSLLSLLKLFFTPEDTLNIVTYLVPFLFSYAILNSNIKYFPILLLILLLPLHLTNTIVQLRQGFASAIFILGFFSKNRHIKNVLILTAPFIHSTFIILTPIYYFFKWFDFKKLSLGLRSIVLVLFISIVTILLPIAAYLFGARQFNYIDFDKSAGTGGMFVFWFVVLLLTFLQGKKFQTKYLFEIYCVMFFLFMYFQFPIAGRIFNSVMPLAMISFLNMTGTIKYFYIGFIVLLFSLLWVGRSFSLNWLMI